MLQRLAEMEEGRTRKDYLEPHSLEPLIFAVRSHRVMLDSALARLYGVSTKRFNETLKRNRNRFPSDFAFRLSAKEYSKLRSQIATSSLQHADLSEESAHPGVGVHGGRRSIPWVFTEHGALMAANIVRSKRAVQMSIYVIRAFVRLRERAASNAAVLQRLAEIDSTLLEHDAALRDVYRKLLPLLQPPPDRPRRQIGFHTGDE